MRLHLWRYLAGVYLQHSRYWKPDFLPEMGERFASTSSMAGPSTAFGAKAAPNSLRMTVGEVRQNFSSEIFRLICRAKPCQTALC